MQSQTSRSYAHFGVAESEWTTWKASSVYEYIFKISLFLRCFLLFRPEQGSQVSYENVDVGHVHSLVSEGYTKVSQAV